MNKTILIFLDVVAHKNRLQTEAIREAGFEPVFFVSRGKENTQGQIVLENGFRKRWQQVNTWIRDHKKNIHHLEVYPGGRFSFIYMLLAKRQGLPCICVERGDLLYYRRGGYSRAARISMWLCYKMADIIWYREPYMKPVLEKLNSCLFFLHNAVPVSQGQMPGFAERDIDFLWLNRLIPQRKSGWFADILRHGRLASSHNVLVGMDDSSHFKDEQQYVSANKPAQLELIAYTADPGAFYRRARYFVLPADVVFANHALLEAMSHGVVPIVSRVEGAELIVRDKENGFLPEHTQAAFEAAMLDAFSQDEKEWKKMSAAARLTIQNNFSEEKYREAIKTLYGRLEAAQRSA